MNPTPQPSRTEMIQRLVDGELSESERSAMLRKIDDETPELWRDVALGLLGNRIVAEGLRATMPAPAIVSPAPVEKVIVFPAWKRLGALAATLAIGVGIGFFVPQQRHVKLAAEGSGQVTVLANMDDFKKVIGEALEQSRTANGRENMLAGGPLGDDEDRPFASAGGGGLRPFAANPEPEAVRPRPSPIDASAKREGVESKMDEILKSVADINRTLQSLQNERK